MKLSCRYTTIKNGQVVKCDKPMAPGWTLCEEHAHPRVSLMLFRAVQEENGRKKIELERMRQS